MGEQTAKAPGLNRAKTYQLVLFPLNNGATNVYYVLVLSYIATFGSKVLALSMLFASVMVTGMRLFDAITDPIIGALMDRTNGKFGKFRPFMVIGNLIMAASVLALYCLTPLIPANAMNGVTAETKIVSVTPWWKIALICVDVVLGVLVAVSIFMLVKRIKARKAAKALTAPAEDQE